MLSGMTKLGVPAAFTVSINSYEMPLPTLLVQVMSVALPPLELLLGVWLLIGLFTRFSAAVSGGLMVIFLIAMVQAALRGVGWAHRPSQPRHPVQRAVNPGPP